MLATSLLRFRTWTAVSLALVLAVSACGKKEAPPAPPAAPATAAAAAGAAAAATAAAAEPAKPAEPPPPPDVELAAGDAVVAWLSFRSFTSLFDAIELLATRLEAAPPGVSLRQAALDELTKGFAALGIVGHEWIDKTRGIHVIYQDDSPQDPKNGAAVLLPVVDKEKALAALTAAKKGAEAGGHEALLTLGQQQIYVDFMDKVAVLTVDAGRFAKVKAFATRLSAIEVPAAVYLGLSVKDAVQTRGKDLEQALAQLEQVGKASAEPGSSATMDYYTRMLREWSQSLTRVELLIDANTDDIQAAVRMHAIPGSKLGVQMASSRGRKSLPLAASLPANAYLAFVSSLDPKANLDQAKDAIKLLGELFKLDPAAIAAVEADIRMLAEKQDGTSGLAMYADGESPLGVLAFAGAEDPATVLTLGKKLVSQLALKILELEEQKAKAADPKAPADPKLAIVKRALTDMKVDPLIEAFGPVGKEAGVTVTANTTKADGVSCDVIDFTFDWAKIEKAGGEDAARARPFVGDRLAISLCTGAARLVLTVGPSAFEQGRRAAAGKVGGLDEAPVFKAAAEKGVQSPIWFAYANLGAAIAAVRKAMPEAAALELPADRAIAVSCGHRATSYGCELDVPVTVAGALAKIAKRQAKPGP